MTIRPAGLPPMVMSKNTRGLVDAMFVIKDVSGVQAADIESSEDIQNYAAVVGGSAF